MDEKVIEAAKSLIKTINESGRSVLRQDCLSEDVTTIKRFGSIDVLMFDNKIQVSHSGDESYIIHGEIESYS